MIEGEATFGERIADLVAGFGGSWTFIITFFAILTIYTAISMLAALQAPVIMMSQNRQDTKDRLRGELDYDVNRRAESEIQSVSRKLNLLNDKFNDLEQLVQETTGGPTGDKNAASASASANERHAR